MTYIVLARKYRPQRFDDLIGQEAIATTLKNAIASHRVAHAYLFTGPRGVGKTSLARIFAKALNCKTGPTPTPCSKCQACQDIEGGSSLDVIEIDGASNRGIDDVRAIRENVKFAPANGKFKIYIIDEVHQITQDGFNALLKTLEEPPPHVKFIFATTAPQKVPPTILSRCQRFDFKRIPIPQIVDVLTNITKKEKFKISQDALLEIAKIADGSLRDSQSLLDQVASFSKEKITFEDVSEALGLLSEEEFIHLFQAIADKDASFVLEKVNEVIEKGKDPIYFLERCLEHVRNLMIVNASPNLSKLIDTQDTHKESLKKQSQSFSRQDLFYLFSVISKGIQNIKWSNVKRVALEMSLLKCTLREPMMSLNEVKNESKPKSATPRTAPPKTAVNTKKSDSVKTPVIAKTTAPKTQTGQSPKAEIDNDAAVALDEIWPNFMKRIKSEKMSAASYLMEAKPVEENDGTVVIGFPGDFSFHAEALATDENLKLLEKHISELLDKETRIKFILHGDSGKPEETEGSSEMSQDKEEDKPILKSAAGIFGGRIVKR